MEQQTEASSARRRAELHPRGGAGGAKRARGYDRGEQDEAALALLTKCCLEELEHHNETDEPEAERSSRRAAPDRCRKRCSRRSHWRCCSPFTFSIPLFSAPSASRPRTSARHTRVTAGSLGHPLQNSASMRSSSLPGISAHYDALASAFINSAPPPPALCASQPALSFTAPSFDPANPSSLINPAHASTRQLNGDSTHPPHEEGVAHSLNEPLSPGSADAGAIDASEISSERDGGGRKKRKRRDGSRSTGKKRRRWRQSAWSRREDADLMAAVQHYGEGQWARIAAAVDNGRTGKQCRDRWLNKTTNGNQRRSAWTVEEERQLVKAHKELGNKWAAIARTIGNKSENCVKNRWFSEIRRNQIPPAEQFGPLRSYLASIGLVRRPSPPEVGGKEMDEERQHGEDDRERKEDGENMEKKMGERGDIHGQATSPGGGRGSNGMRGTDRMLMFESGVDTGSVISSICPELCINGEATLMCGCANLSSNAGSNFGYSDGFKGRLETACKSVRNLHDSKTADAMMISVGFGQVIVEEPDASGNMHNVKHASFAVAIWTPQVGGSAPAAHNLCARIKKQLR